MLTINIIGAGRLGKTLAKLIVKYQAGEILCVYNRTVKEAQKSITFIGQGRATASLDDINPANISFITTPDDHIQKTGALLLKNQPDGLFVHCSGSKTANIFATKNAVSAHPLKSFADPMRAVASFSGTYCSIESPCQTAALTIEALFKKIGAKPFFIKKDQKPLYHSASVFGSNYLVTLYQSARTCLEHSDIPSNTAHEIAHALLQGTLDNIGTLKEAKTALTGPIQRGDLATIATHIAALNSNQHLKILYQALGNATVDLTSHHASIKSTLEKLFSQK